MCIRDRERCPYSVIGVATDEPHLLITDRQFANQPVDLPMDALFGKPPKMHRDTRRVARVLKPLVRSGMTLDETIGRVLAHPRSEWLMRDAALEPSLAQAVSHWVAQGRPVEPSGHAGRYGDYIVSHAGVPDAEWVVFRTVAHDRVLTGLADARRQAVLVGAVVALAGGLALLVTTFVMLRPLRRLEACAGVLARGDAPKDDEWPRVTGELGQLTHVLRPFDSDTLAVVAYNLARAERLAEAALPSFAIVLVGLLPVLLLVRAMRR